MVIKDYYLVIITLLLTGRKKQEDAVRYGGCLLSCPTRVSPEESLAHLCLETGKEAV